MNYAVLIPARAGSVRLKNKNLRILGNKKLISWTINFAEKLISKKKIFISTDCQKIINLFKKKVIIIKRPKYLSTSKSSTEAVIDHFVRKTKNFFDFLILLQPTSPFRSLSSLKVAIKMFKRYQVNIISVSKFTKDDLKKPVFVIGKKKIIKRSQIKIKLFQKIINKKLHFINGNFYILSLKKFNQKKVISYKFIPLIEKHKKNKLDIDTLKDLQKANKFIN
jgi:CMP-N,N'-diacetyllegionaminic acid synthase